MAAGRSLAGLSQRDLAIKAGVHRTVIGRYEIGVTRMRSDLLQKIIDALGEHGVCFVTPTAKWDGGGVMLSLENRPENL